MTLTMVFWAAVVTLWGGLAYWFLLPAGWRAPRRQDQFLTTLQTLLQQHAEQVDRLLASQDSTHRAISGMVEQMAGATAKQAEAFTAYLQSFSSAGPGRSWVTPDNTTTSMDELVKLGFPVNAPPAEQAAWLEAYVEQQPW